MGGPGMSLVIPVYNMSHYLPELLASLSAQAEVGCGVEVVFVDDGSTDGSDGLVEAWVSTASIEATLIRQENGGVSNARNTGLRVATGEWVSFPDADDVLDPHYLRRTWRFLQSKWGRRSTFVANRVLRLNDEGRRITDDHPLRFRFENGRRTVDMLTKPDYFQLHAASSFFRRDELIRSGTEFPEGVSASEDAMFIIDHLLVARAARLGLNPDAVYYYRRRADDSTIERYIRSPGRAYLERFGRYAKILRRAARSGSVPVWLQSMVLYELHWALAPWQRIGSSRSTLPSGMGRAILDAFAQCAEHLDADVVFRYDATALSMEARLVILSLCGIAPPRWVSEHPDCVDLGSGMTRWRAWRLGDANGAPIPPPGRRQAWRRSLTYFADVPLCEAYEWRSGVWRGRARDRAVVADRARRIWARQRAFALPSRVADMRVRRVRWGGSRLPMRALTAWGLEGLRRGPLSRTRLRTGFTVGAHAHSSRVSDDPIAMLSTVRRLRPKLKLWDLTVRLSPPVSHDAQLALAEVSAVETEHVHA